MALWNYVTFLCVANSTLCQFAALICAFMLKRSMPRSEKRRLAKAGLLLFGSIGMLFSLGATALFWRHFTLKFGDALDHMGGPLLFPMSLLLAALWLCFLVSFWRTLVAEATDPDSVIQGWGHRNAATDFYGGSAVIWVLTTVSVWMSYLAIASHLSLFPLVFGNQLAFIAISFGRPMLITPRGLQSDLFRIPFSQIVRLEYQPIPGRLGPYQVSCELSRWRLLIGSKRIQLYGVTEAGIREIETERCATSKSQAVSA